MKDLQRVEFMSIIGFESEEMVGEHIRKEPMQDIEKWKNRGEVWERVETRGIAKYIAKLHDFDLDVTNSMVNSWKDGKVKANGVSFQVIEEVVAAMFKILVEGFKFFRDKKLSTNVVKDFVKSSKEKNELVKCETYYDMESVKKFWRYVLHAIIEYITLDPRFDRVRTYHFVLLNHFYHDIKISFLYYLFTSMNKAISSFKKKPSVNPTLYVGLLLLIHEYFKAQTISNNPCMMQMLLKTWVALISLLILMKSRALALRGRRILPWVRNSKKGHEVSSYHYPSKEESQGSWA